MALAVVCHRSAVIGNITACKETNQTNRVWFILRLQRYDKFDASPSVCPSRNPCSIRSTYSGSVGLDTSNRSGNSLSRHGIHRACCNRSVIARCETMRLMPKLNRAGVFTWLGRNGPHTRECRWGKNLFLNNGNDLACHAVTKTKARCLHSTHCCCSKFLPGSITCCQIFVEYADDTT